MFSKLRAVGVFCVCMVLHSHAQRGPSVTSVDHSVVQPSLITPGSKPFHMLAGVTDGQSVIGSIEWLWIDPQHYRRIIKSKEFTQNLVVNGSEIQEENSADYIPLQWQTFAMALVDSSYITKSVRDGDRLETKANGKADESGIVCFDKARKLCRQNPGGLREIVAASGHSVEFTDYQNFEGKRVARTITNASRLGEQRLTVKVVGLEKWDKPYDTLLDVKTASSPDTLLQSTVLEESDLRKQALQTPEIIWPQPLDGGEHGPASFYISTDKTGKVREALPLYTTNERTNESAVRQLLRWTFNPLTKDGVRQQIEGVLSFTLETRKFGPKEPLSDVTVRKLARGVVEPKIDGSKYPAGTTYSIWAAIDSDGQLIEAMPGYGPNELWQPCYDAMRSWHFSPLMEEGSPRPYRANVIFHVN